MYVGSVRQVQAHRRAIVVQTASNVDAGYNRKVSEHSVHSLLHMGMQR